MRRGHVVSHLCDGFEAGLRTRCETTGDSLLYVAKTLNISFNNQRNDSCGLSLVWNLDLTLSDFSEGRDSTRCSMSSVIYVHAVTWCSQSFDCPSQLNRQWFELQANLVSSKNLSGEFSSVSEHMDSVSVARHHLGENLQLVREMLSWRSYFLQLYI